MIEVAGVLAQHLYRRSRTRWLRRLGRVDAPWMLPREEDLVVEALTHLRPMRSLEWGAGGSTLAFPRLLPVGASWLSVEHDADWAGSLRTRRLSPGVEIAHVPPNRTPWTGEGTGDEFRTYLDYPAARGPFDFVLIDGRARSGALAAAPKLLAPGGLVILHDANRNVYRSALPDLRHQVLFEDARVRSRRPSGGVWMATADRPIETLVNLHLHRRVWAVYRALRTKK